MPLFYFDIREGAQLLPDEDGQWFPDLDTAEHEAALLIASLGREALRKGKFQSVSVEVRDDIGYRLVTTGIKLTVDRLRRAPLRV